MNRIILIFVSFFTVLTMSAQTYTIISRNNQDTVKLFPNALGRAIKNIIPGKDDQLHNLLIKKVQNGKESLLFVELSQDEKKIITSYETDLVTPGKWGIKIYTLADVYAQLKRVNAILMQGNIIGINLYMHQRPDNFQDLLVIDDYEFPSPIKIVVLDEAQKAAERQKIQAERQKNESEQQWQHTSTQASTQQTEDPNDYYIAYLISSKRFNEAQDKTLLKELCPAGNYLKLAERFDTLVLKASGKGHDPRLEQYAK